MTKIFYKLTVILTCMLVASSAHAYKYVIFTDDIKTDKAEKIAELMKNSYPFSTFDIEVEIVRLQPEELTCGSKYGIDRLVQCENMGEIQKKTMLAGGDQAMIIKDIAKYGGSSFAGGVPTITTGTNARGMLHEYMHTLGLCDEYEYPASEATIYCSRGNRPNLVFIEPLDPYTADSMARGKHMGVIRWSKDIIPTTPITNTNGTRLGTGDVDFNNIFPINMTDVPEALSEPIGLYKGKICNNAVPSRISWHPGGKASIMQNTNAGLGAPLEKIVERLMLSKGAKKKLQYQEVEEKVSESENAPGSVAVNPSPFTKINNTARTLFKSFFGWVKDVIKKVDRVFSI